MAKKRYHYSDRRDPNDKGSSKGRLLSRRRVVSIQTSRAQPAASSNEQKNSGNGNGGNGKKRKELLRQKEKQLSDLNEESEKRRREENEKTRLITDGLTPEEVVAMCFNLWAQNYDMEMEGHVRAILKLLEGAKRLENVEYWARNPIFGRKLRDFSIGTAAIEAGLPEILSQEFCSQMTIHGNDISENMIEFAEQKLAGKFASVRITNEDMAKVRLYMEYDIAMLSQTLPFIPNKATAFSKIMASLGFGGTMLLIDEWPPKLSVGDTTSSIPKRLLFGSDMGYFKPISIGDVRQVYLGNIKNCRIEGQLRLPIPPDYNHDMYLLWARKVKDDLQGYVPPNRAANMLLQGIIELQNLEPWSSSPIISDRIREFCPMSEVVRRRKRKKRNETTLVSNLKKHYQELTDRSQGTYAVMELSQKRLSHNDFGSYGQTKDTVIINSAIHMIPLDEVTYRRLARVVRPGKNLVIIDKWPPDPETVHANNGRYINRMEVKNMLKKIGFDMFLENWIPTSQDSGVCAMAFRKRID